ncbi:MAG: PilZ domain-containing protein [Gammaproteobacteria bacterium]
MNTVTDYEHRTHPRLKHHAKIRVTLPDLAKRLIADMRDFSEGGLYLLWSNDFGELKNGAVIEVQTTEIDDAPIQIAEVVRIDPGEGIALRFVTADSGSNVQ